MNRLRYIYAASTILWLAVVGAGDGIMFYYENGPGTSGEVPSCWPADSRIARDAGLPTLVMFAHPRCPCTRASIGELAILMARCQGQVSTHVLCFKPADSADGWEKTDIWHAAAAIPGVTVTTDTDGVEARRFGAQTSGHALLYDPKGMLLFSGGITGSRGHSGDNAGRSSVARLLNGATAERPETYVFGCSLLDPSSECTQGSKACHNRE
jgi:hypothetical protein